METIAAAIRAAQLLLAVLAVFAIPIFLLGIWKAVELAFYLWSVLSC